jgi:putative DNA primase/helicase
MGAAAIARQLGATRQGGNWRAACPCGCGYCLSFCDGENDALLAFCFGGCTFNAITSALVEYGLLDGDDCDNPHAAPNTPHVGRDDPKRIARAQQIYGDGVWDERTDGYLRGRFITLTSPILKFHERAPHRLGARLPAMLAPVVNVAGDQTGVHMTYLRPDGGGKVDLPKQYQRECRGVIRGGAIRLAEHDPDTALVVGEGVESTLSAMQIFGLPGWSAVFAGGLKTVALPSTIRAVIIAADHDVNHAGQRNALAAYDRWTAEGRSVRVKLPPDVGADFNDVLRTRCGHAWH